MPTTVINIRKHKNWRREGVIYIGRGSVFGNPYRIGKDGDRAEVIEKYRLYFVQRLEMDDEFCQAVSELAGKTLGCYCIPRRCHGHIIAEFLDGGEPNL